MTCAVVVGNMNYVDLDCVCMKGCSNNAVVSDVVVFKFKKRLKSF